MNILHIFWIYVYYLYSEYMYMLVDILKLPFEPRRWIYHNFIIIWPIAVSQWTFAIFIFMLRLFSKMKRLLVYFCGRAIWPGFRTHTKINFFEKYDTSSFITSKRAKTIRRIIFCMFLYIFRHERFNTPQVINMITFLILEVLTKGKWLLH